MKTRVCENRGIKGEICSSTGTKDEQDQLCIDFGDQLDSVGDYD